MQASAFRELLSPAGQEALQSICALEPKESDFLRHLTASSRRYPLELARAALEIAILRQEAREKFSCADQMYFTREALEQASPSVISDYRAERYRPFAYLADLGCSIGADTLALAGLAPVLALDLDPLRLAMARANHRALAPAHEAQFIQADLASPLPFSTRLPDPLALFFDPSRRAGGRRVFSVRAYTPPLEVVSNWLPSFRALGAKISPGVRLEEIASFDTEIEFISLGGGLKEATLWFGPLKTGERRATILPGPHTLVANRAIPAIGMQSSLPLSEPRPYLYEPDPAVLRAGLVATLGEQLEAAQLDADIAYLTADQRRSTPFARRWAVEAWFPFNLKRLRAYLRERGVGRVVVKKRGSPIQPEELIHDLRLHGDAERVVFLTHLKGKPIVILAWED